jgi:hypothetical protein
MLLRPEDLPRLEVEAVDGPLDRRRIGRAVRDHRSGDHVRDDLRLPDRLAIVDTKGREPVPRPLVRVRHQNRWSGKGRLRHQRVAEPSLPDDSPVLGVDDVHGAALGVEGHPAFGDHGGGGAVVAGLDLPQRLAVVGGHRVELVAAETGPHEELAVRYRGRGQRTVPGDADAPPHASIRTAEDLRSRSMRAASRPGDLPPPARELPRLDGPVLVEKRATTDPLEILLVALHGCPPQPPPRARPTPGSHAAHPDVQCLESPIVPAGREWPTNPCVVPEKTSHPVTASSESAETASHGTKIRGRRGREVCPRPRASPLPGTPRAPSRTGRIRPASGSAAPGASRRPPGPPCGGRPRRPGTCRRRDRGAGA